MAELSELAEDVVGLVDAVVRPLVDEPDALAVEAYEEEDGTIVVEVRVADDDAGKVIGRQGRVIKAVRTLARAAAARDGAHVEVELID